MTIARVASMHRQRASAQVYTWTAVSILLLLVFGGIVADAGRLFVQRVAIHRLADAAARAGAMEINEAAMRANPEACPHLDTNAARAAAERHLSSARDLNSRVEATDEVVGVEVQRQVETTILGLFGTAHVELRARAFARPRAGVSAAREECR
jgi:uncharacterized membrane protein